MNLFAEIFNKAITTVGPLQDKDVLVITYYVAQSCHSVIYRRQAYGASQNSTLRDFVSPDNNNNRLFNPA